MWKDIHDLLISTVWLLMCCCFVTTFIVAIGGKYELEFKTELCTYIYMVPEAVYDGETADFKYLPDLKNSSEFHSLRPFWDIHKCLRVGGRLSKFIITMWEKASYIPTFNSCWSSWWTSRTQGDYLHQQHINQGFWNLKIQKQCTWHFQHSLMMRTSIILICFLKIQLNWVL